MGIKHKGLLFALCGILIICGLEAFLGHSGITRNSNATDVDEQKVSVKIPPRVEGMEPVEYNSPQKLEKEELSVLLSDGRLHDFVVEVAKTKKEQRIGMMFRNHVDKNTGMLFLFETESDRGFWMKNTHIPLDIIFIRKDGIVHHIHSMAEPESLEIIPSHGKVIAALEINGGDAEALGIHVGDRVLHKAFQQEDAN